MLELTVDQAYYMAGIYDDDSDFEKDLKLSSWLDRQTYCCVRSQQELIDARASGVDVIIIKENKDVSKS